MTAAPEADRPSQSNEAPVVLVVEDEPMVREFAVRALQGLGYTVLEASNGEEGLEKMQKQPVDQPLDLF